MVLSLFSNLVGVVVVDGADDDRLDIDLACDVDLSCLSSASVKSDALLSKGLPGIVKVVLFAIFLFCWVFLSDENYARESYMIAILKPVIAEIY